MTNLESILLNSKVLDKKEINCREIPRDKIRSFYEGKKYATKDWTDYKNPYPYCKEFRIIKFFDKKGNWIGESLSTLVVINGYVYALLYHGLGNKANKINKIVVEGECKARHLIAEFYLKEFELPLIKLKDFDGNVVIR